MWQNEWKYYKYSIEMLHHSNERKWNCQINLDGNKIHESENLHYTNDKFYNKIMLNIL